MRYKARELINNVNVSRASPVKELFILLGGVFGIILAVYIALGFAVDLIVPKLPPSIEESLGKLFTGMYENTEQSPAGERLQEILDKLSDEDIDNGLDYKVHLVLNPDINAMALPGGNIVIFSGIIGELESENELAFVLAHELGHFDNRDHLRGLGRGLVLFTISATLLGADSTAANFIMNSIANIEMKFSQRQEMAADMSALELLNRSYGHVAGATDFFDKMSKKEEKGRFLYYFATHPYPEDRINAIKKEIEEKGYQVKDKIPLDVALSNIKDSSGLGNTE